MALWWRRLLEKTCKMWSISLRYFLKKMLMSTKQDYRNKWMFILLSVRILFSLYKALVFQSLVLKTPLRILPELGDKWAIGSWKWHFLWATWLQAWQTSPCACPPPYIWFLVFGLLVCYFLFCFIFTKTGFCVKCMSYILLIGLILKLTHIQSKILK